MKRLPPRPNLLRSASDSALPAALLLALFVLFGPLACVGDEGGQADEPAQEESIPFRDDGELTFLRGGEEVITIDIEIAASDSARQRGLMQRTSLPDESGMLFIFDREETQSFWMANTPLALDLFFVNNDSQIVEIARYTRPFSSTSIASDEPARYVIEVPAGFADTYGLVESERVRWSRE